MGKHCDVLKAIPTMEAAPNIFENIKAIAGRQLARSVANVNLMTARKVRRLDAKIELATTTQEKDALKAEIQKVKKHAADRIVAKAVRVQKRARDKMTRYLAAAQMPKARKQPFPKGSTKVKKTLNLARLTPTAEKLKKTVKLAVRMVPRILERDSCTPTRDNRARAH